MGVGDVTVATWVINYKCEWEYISISVFLDFLAEQIDFICCFWIKLSSLFLDILKAFNSVSQEPFNCID
jgi:hypothetical protein